MTAKSIAVAVVLIFTLLSRPVIARQQATGDISCDVILDYVATNPAYFDVFRAYLDGYIAGEINTGKLVPNERNAEMLMPEVIAYCKLSRDATFSSAVAASVK